MSEKYLDFEIEGDIAILSMNRPGKRNAMCSQLLEEIDAFFSKPPADVKAAILTGTEGH